MNQESIRNIGVLLFEECWNKGNETLLEEIMSHTHNFHMGETEVVGRDIYGAIMRNYLSAFNPEFEVVRTVVDQDYLAIHYNESGTFNKPWKMSGLKSANGDPLQPTGKSYSTFGIELVRLENGKIVDSWPGHQSFAQYYQAGIIHQLA